MGILESEQTTSATLPELGEPPMHITMKRITNFGPWEVGPDFDKSYAAEMYFHARTARASLNDHSLDKHNFVVTEYRMKVPAIFISAWRNYRYDNWRRLYAVPQK